MTSLYVTDPKGFRAYAGGENKEYPVLLVDDGENQHRILMKSYNQLARLKEVVDGLWNEHCNSELRDEERVI